MYRAVYRRSYKAIKSVDRKNQVLFGELAPHEKRGLSIGPLRFLREVFCMGGGRKRPCARLRADGIAIHPYEFNHRPSFRPRQRDSVTIGTLDRLTSALKSLRRARALTAPRGGAVPIHLTEFGYFASGKRGLPAKTRSKYLRQAYRIARRTKGVRQIVQYQLIQTPQASWNTGVLKPGGVPDGSFFGLKRAAAAARR